MIAGNYSGDGNFIGLRVLDKRLPRLMIFRDSYMRIKNLIIAAVVMAVLIGGYFIVSALIKPDALPCRARGRYDEPTTIRQR